MLHKLSFYQYWLERKQRLAINSNGLDDFKTGFDVNVLHENTWHSLPYEKRDEQIDSDRVTTPEAEVSLAKLEQDCEHIECLIVTCKATSTVPALKSVSHRLTPDSTVLLLQNGMGTIDELNEKVFPDPNMRPDYMCGVMSHGLTGKRSLQVAHTGVGTTILSPYVPRDSPMAKDKKEDWTLTTKYLMRTLTLTPSLVAVAETPSSLLQYQLEKLAMNAVINPLGALMNCTNGELLYNFSFTRLMRLLLLEISSVICALPELQGVPGIEQRFAPERLRAMVVQLANKTANNHNSMLQDVQQRRTTEIEYINGYIIRRGEEVGIKCAVNYMILHMVRAKLDMLKQRESGAVPVDLLGSEDSEDSG